MPMEGSSPPTGRSMTGKSIAFSSLRGCHRKPSKPERSGWRDAFTLLARSLAVSQTRAPASGGIFPGIWATCWRTFRTLGRHGIRVSNCRQCGWKTTASIVCIDNSKIRTGTALIGGGHISPMNEPMLCWSSDLDTEGKRKEPQ